MFDPHTARGAHTLVAASAIVQAIGGEFAARSAGHGTFLVLGFCPAQGHRRDPLTNAAHPPATVGLCRPNVAGRPRSSSWNGGGQSGLSAAIVSISIERRGRSVSATGVRGDRLPDVAEPPPASRAVFDRQT